MTVRTPIALLLVLAISTMPGVPPARTANQTAGLAAAVPATKVIRFGRIVDGRGAVLTNAVVIVQGDRIRSVSTSPSAVIADAEVIDLSRYTGLPGLSDVHTHLTFSYLPGREPRFPAIAMFLGQESARTTLESGVTTVHAKWILRRKARIRHRRDRTASARGVALSRGIPGRTQSDGRLLPDRTRVQKAARGSVVSRGRTMFEGVRQTTVWNAAKSARLPDARRALAGGRASDTRHLGARAGSPDRTCSENLLNTAGSW